MFWIPHTQELCALIDVGINPDLAFDLGELHTTKDLVRTCWIISETTRHKAVREGLQRSFKEFTYFCGFIKGVHSKVDLCKDEQQTVLQTVFSVIPLNQLFICYSHQSKYWLIIIINISQAIIHLLMTILI